MRYTEGICGDGVAILKDGLQMSVSEILKELNAKEKIIKMNKVYAGYFYNLNHEVNCVNSHMEELLIEANNE